MGFVPDRKVFRLDFDDESYEGAYDGLTVRARSVALGTYLELVSLADDVEGLDEATAAKTLGDLLEGFAGALVSWNVEEEPGVPVPATLDGLRGQEIGFVLVIIRAWLSAIGDVAAPLGIGSPAGERSAPPPLPMEPLSPSRAS